MSRSADLYQVRTEYQKDTFFFSFFYLVLEFAVFLIFVLPNTKTWCNEFALETLCKETKKIECDCS
jgi:hypothetical protein